MIDLHGQPDRLGNVVEYGLPFRGEWRFIADDLEKFLNRVEREGLFFITNEEPQA